MRREISEERTHDDIRGFVFRANANENGISKKATLCEKCPIRESVECPFQDMTPSCDICPIAHEVLSEVLNDAELIGYYGNIAANPDQKALGLELIINETSVHVGFDGLQNGLVKGIVRHPVQTQKNST